MIRPFDTTTMIVTGPTTQIPLDADSVNLTVTRDTVLIFPAGFDGQRLSLRVTQTDPLVGFWANFSANVFTTGGVIFTLTSYQPVSVTGSGQVDYFELSYVAIASAWVATVGINNVGVTA